MSSDARNNTLRNMILFIFCIFYICNVIESFEVTTTLGRIRGQFVQDEQFNVSYWMFRGIPYAQPPVGNLRFQAPAPKTPWPGVFNAIHPVRVCLQPELYHSKVEMSENCLTFNVYTPTNVTNSSLPVILNIHGGDFNLQSGNVVPIYGPQLLVKNNIVVVTVNYRLGPIGFISFSSETVPGNAGLKDVVLALKVIHENIAAFGGDPNRITLRGNGAGACLAQYMMLLDQTRGMFQNAMVFEGSVLSPKYFQLNPRENALALARELDLDTSSDANLLAQLKLVNGYDIIRAQDAIASRDPRRALRHYRPFKPTVEVAHQGAVLTKTPLALITEGALQDLTMFVGFNDQEGLEMYPVVTREPELLEILNRNFELVIPEDIQYPPGSQASINLASQIKNMYFNGRNMSLSNIQNITNLISDLYYTYHVDVLVKLFKEKNNSPLYYSIFGGDTELNWFKAFANISFPGAAHSDNIGYMFVTSVTKTRYQNLSTKAKIYQNNMLRNLKTFSSSGVPPPNTFFETGPGRFHTVTTPTGPALVYSSPLPDRIRFWTSVYEQYRSSISQGSQGSQNSTVNPGSQTNTSSAINTTSTNPKTNLTTGLIPSVLSLVNNTLVHLLTGLLG